MLESLSALRTFGTAVARDVAPAAHVADAAAAGGGELAAVVSGAAAGHGQAALAAPRVPQATSAVEQLGHVAPVGQPTSAEVAERVAHFSSLRDADGMVRVRMEDGRIGNGMPADPDWHKGNPTYQVYTRTFADGNGDGTGDFRGVVDHLDHLQYMRQKGMWISPHFPSGGKDGGFDIKDYKAVNEQLGTMRDFERIVDEAHGRGIRVTTEMVMNHTSEEHVWFAGDPEKGILGDVQRAAQVVKDKGRSGAQEWAHSTGDDSPMYVWDFSHTKEQGPPERLSHLRVIFNDTEPSNWSWNDDAGGWYLHRFFAAQPDLNWENPKVTKEFEDVVRFWLDKGVDEVRFDAEPYLFKDSRTAHGTVYHGEGTDRTHAKLQEFYQRINGEFADRKVLGEANLDKPATRDFVGTAERPESDRLFDFSTMPQLFMSVIERDKSRALEALKSKGGLPDHFDWISFLRLHDEMTLEKVTPVEREWMWKLFTEGDATRGISADPEARINLGLRHRLIDLVGHDDDPVMKRRAVEMMHALHLSQSGAPLMYQGDEIGMGAIRGKGLVDRERVRGAMRWTAGANHGFSTADRVLEPIDDAVEGANLVNVAAQKADPDSLMNRVRGMYLAREQSAVMQGTARETEVSTGAKEVLAFQRANDTERVVSVVNLSPGTVSSSIDLDVPQGWHVERLHGSRNLDLSHGVPKELTLEPYEYQWLRVVPDTAAPAATAAEASIAPVAQASHAVRDGVLSFGGGAAVGAGGAALLGRGQSAD